jgi:His-Xaa-Ser system protein HxsD
MVRTLPPTLLLVGWASLAFGAGGVRGGRSVAEGELTIALFDAHLCSGDAIQRAAYRVSDRISVECRLMDGEYRCQVWAADGGVPSPADVAAFRIAVNDQALRERIRDETAAVRNVVLALAFSQTGLSEGS